MKPQKNKKEVATDLKNFMLSKQESFKVNGGYPPTTDRGTIGTVGRPD